MLNGGVTVWVGIQRYPGIDAVTDPEALAMIRAAAAEWERQSTSLNHMGPGLFHRMPIAPNPRALHLN
jgi:hypothetical protein